MEEQTGKCNMMKIIYEDLYSGVEKFDFSAQYLHLSKIISIFAAVILNNKANIYINRCNALQGKTFFFAFFSVLSLVIRVILLHTHTHTHRSHRQSV